MTTYFPNNQIQVEKTRTHTHNYSRSIARNQNSKQYIAYSKREKFTLGESPQMNFQKNKKTKNN